MKNAKRDKFIKEILSMKSDFSSSDLIYHYTSPSGLLGILGKDQISLYFSRYDCVNDISEGKSILESFSAACLELLKDEKIDLGFYNLIHSVNIPSSTLFLFKDEDHYYHKKRAYQAYICCFSLESDSLPMWNYYVKNGHYQGYNIGIHRSLFSKFINADEEYIFQLKRVIYETDEKKYKIKKFITAAYNAYKTIEIIDDESIISFCEGFLFNAQLEFKSACYSHEKEVRAIIYLPQLQELKEEFKVEYMDRKGFITPYINIGTKRKNPLHEITIGPLVETKISKSTLESLLVQREYDLGNIKIKNSSIPIRLL